jgi:hypothetical protein
MPNSKKLHPKKAVCKHEGCFEDASIKGYCRVHLLSVLKGKAEGDQKPRAQLQQVPPEKRQNSRLQFLEEEAGLDEVFAAQQAERLGELDLELEEQETALLDIRPNRRFRKAG